VIAQRSDENPILKPKRNHVWESLAVFNGCPIKRGKETLLMYRAVSQPYYSVLTDNTLSVSSIGIARSKDGIHFSGRRRFIFPEYPWERFGCEDPRLTKVGNRIYIFYTAYNGKNPPRVAVTYISVRNFLIQKWKWSKPVLITPPQFDNKDAFLFPKAIDEKYICVHRLGNHIDYDFCSNLDQKLKGNVWLDEHCWIEPRKGWWDSKKVGAAAPPFITREGWIMLYHGVSEDEVYRVGAVLLDLKNPLKILARTIYPIFEPEAPYERDGQVPKVVFPCGNEVLSGEFYMYYGGGDSVVGVATVRVRELLKILRLCQF
jgi:predicted GH43/DUF377 family glycosyl hydrolase